MSTPSKLSQLRELSVVVADTGDYEAIKRLQPVDCTTNPTLVKKALDLPVYAELIERELAWGRQQGGDREAVVHAVADRLTIGVGALLSTLVPGRVSTEVDADQAHDTAATVAKARQFIQMYADAGVPREKILIKIAATWEGVEAARVLQAEGIDCNLTLIFNPTQALACSEAGAFLISPFVGRILDWYVANGQTPANIDEDPGVVFVRGVYAEFKRRGSPTVVMGASFRSTAQIEALAGCDRLTISPDLLEKLDADHGALPRKLVAGAAEAVQVTPIDAAKFAADLAADPMATEKLATGIDAFAKDLQALRERIRSEL
ncbi:transaldolase [Stenotrophomonas indicatrix]|jgi:transaldolase|uniref:transaldolase n=1 Tax=Stenotrophomonas indicatrix TaxID=2045451 RepID=A0ABT8QHR4_9GAMM|nr:MULTISPECIES: transaldolase [Stenotrophomonas]EVT71275.1 transaldolase [Stenotrophomonas maltophilia 5BA-I-2]PJL11629.1 transaldolase [Stenotrophomonas maltophilia]EZP43879.1 Transaldolase B [Stenotrophomonas sp. RIT309]MBA0100010.1 transaldolase [Stenotrophomonas indicatrix]MCK6232913.1 transaldolase [Stenotrophomonas indicatrix]